MQSYCGVSKSVINVLFATENICFNKSINLSPTFDMSKEGQCSSTFMKPMRISQEENPYAVSLSLLSQTDHIVRCNTLLVHGAAWSELCMGIMVMAEGKWVLWADLSSYASTIRGSPWLVVRDFHAIRRHDERVEGSNEWLSWMDSLDECINQADFYDLRFWGQFFSWSNRREEGPILRKLDRALVNAEWRADSQGLKPFFC